MINSFPFCGTYEPYIDQKFVRIRQGKLTFSLTLDDVIMAKYLLH